MPCGWSCEYPVEGCDGALPLMRPCRPLDTARIGNHALNVSLIQLASHDQSHHASADSQGYPNVRIPQLRGSHVRQGPMVQFLKGMKNPRIGDLVFEVTTAYRASDGQHINSVGYVVGQSGGATEIRTLEGRDERWSNALFYAIPSERKIGQDDTPPLVTSQSEPSILDRLAKTIRIFGFNCYGVMISPRGLSHNLYQMHRDRRAADRRGKVPAGRIRLKLVME